MSDPRPRIPISELGAVLRATRRSKRMTLRDLAAESGVALNTLSRIERGHVPDLKNFQRVVDWLDLPAETFLEAGETPTTTPEVIARHLRADPRLHSDAVVQIVGLVEEMYHRLAGGQPSLALHLRSAKTFTPAAGGLLSEILTEMQGALLVEADR